MGDTRAGDQRDREIEALRRENERLKARIIELEKKVEELVRGQKRQAAPFSKGLPKENPKKRGRKGGEEYGPKAHREPPPAVDEVIPVGLAAHCECGGSIDYEKTVQQFQEEIPQKPIRRRFDIEVGHCRRCGRRVQGRHALQTSDAIGAAAAQLGPNAQSMATLLHEQDGLSYGKCTNVLERFFGITTTAGALAQVVQRAADRVKEAYQSIRGVVRRSRVIYPDETGWKVEGKLQWMWVFVTRTATLFEIRDSRGYDVPEGVLGADWAGEMIHDGWLPYNRFEQAGHQQCLQHYIRRAEGLEAVAQGAAVRYPRAVLELIGDAFGLRNRRDAGELSPHGLKVAIGRLEARLQRLLEWDLSLEGNVKLRNHVERHQEELFRFLKRPGIEATSWPADHAIRPAVVNRKVFGGNRDPAGARAHEKLASVLATAAKRGVEIVEYVHKVLCTPLRHTASVASRLLGLPLPSS
jgi:transposase